jgi:Caspase domain
MMNLFSIKRLYSQRAGSRVFPILICFLIIAELANADTTIIGNLPQSGDYYPSVNLNPSRLKAELFTMGGTAYTPTTIKLRIGELLGSRLDFATPTVEIRSVTGTLIGPTLMNFALAAPLTTGIQTAVFTSSNPAFSFSPNQSYALVVGSNARASQDNNAFSYVSWYASAPNIIPTGQANWLGQQFNGGTGFGFSNSGLSSFQISGYATPTTLPQPKSFGLFIGVQDSRRAPTLNGDSMANELKAAFANDTSRHVAFALPPVSGVITAKMIAVKLAEIKLQMNAGDSLVLYLNGHGGSVTPPYEGKGNDYVNLGVSLTDKDLYALLSEFDPTGVIRKQTFIDACHAGGFWRSADPGHPSYDDTETGTGDLNLLSNTALFASAAQNKFMYYDSSGRGFFSQALQAAIKNGLESYSAESLNVFLGKESRKLAEFWQDEHPVFYTGELGDPVPSDPDLVKGYFAATADFDMQAPIGAIPEPSTYILMLTGLAVCVGMTRKSSKNISRT